MIRAELSSDAVLVSIQADAATLTLNRADQGNRLDPEMFGALQEATDWLANQDFRALLIRAEGPMFCVGGSIDDFQRVKDFSTYLAAEIPKAHDFIRFLDDLKKPIITAIQGAIGGAGIGIALCGDIVIASDTMKLRGGYLGIGITPDLGTSWRLSRLAGPQSASEILMTNRPFLAQECLELQLVTILVSQADVAQRAQELLELLANGATAALIQTKQLIAMAASQSLATHLDLEERYLIEAAGTEDAKEGVNAFLEKRAARFSGK